MSGGSPGGRSAIPPALPHELRRPGLLERLHARAQTGRGVLVLVAPAGFGKSTLAAAFARETDAPAAWLSLTPADRDPRTLFERLADAFESAFDDPDAVSLPALRASLAGAGAPGAIGLARALLADLPGLPSGFILVLDDYHAVADHPEITGAVDVLVRGLPEMAQVVFTARESPLLGNVHLVAAGRILALGPDDLRFSDDEAAALQRRLGRAGPLPAGAAGWVAGIVLGGADANASGSMALAEYVERHLLAPLPPSARRWLEALAVLDHVTPAGATALLGAGPWHERLARLARQCPFLVATGGGADSHGTHYRLHALVRAPLLDRLRRRGGRSFEQAWRRARSLAEQQHDLPAVVRACLELEALADALAHVRRETRHAMRAGRWSEALLALGLVPPAARHVHTDLLLMEAHALVQSGRSKEARALAERALQVSAHADGAFDLDLDQMAAAAELANIARYEGNLRTALDWLDVVAQVARELPRESRAPPAQRRRLVEIEARALGLRGVCLAIQGDVPAAARQALEEAEDLLARTRWAETEPSRELAAIRNNLAAHCIRTGHYPRAIQALQAASPVWRQLGDTNSLALSQTLLGNLHLRTAALEPAGEALQAAVEAARQIGAPRVEAHAYASEGQWHRASGRLAEAAHALDTSLARARELGEREPLVEALRLRAEVAIVQGNLEQAAELLGTAQANAQHLQSGFQTAGLERALGRLHLAYGGSGLARAIAHFEMALERGGAALGPDDRLALHYWLGTAYLQSGRHDRAEQHLQQAVDLARDAGGPPALAIPAAEDDRLLLYGLQHGEGLGPDNGFLDAARRLAVMRAPWTGAAVPLAGAPLPPPAAMRLEVRLFGSLAVLTGAAPVTLPTRRPSPRRELLALLALHPSGLPSEQIIGCIWPDRDPQNARHNLGQTAYALRTGIGADVVEGSGARYRIAPTVDLWTDTGAFDVLLDRARRQSDPSAQPLLAEAVRLYRGPLLAEVSWPWADDARERYRRRFVDAALRLARLLAPADAAESVHLLERVLAEDASSEAAYAGLIAHAHHAGDTAQARALGRRYTQAQRQAGLAPNPAIVRQAGFTSSD